ncbi:MAG: hypothetical protein K9M57_10970, partial [Phycisphaerae bacterium]|nr:hypothetical protein [Phycisphaerae bacterium]
MNTIEKYNPNPEMSIVESDGSMAEPAPGAQANVLRAILRRWPIVLVVFILVSAIGIPPVWYFVKPAYQASSLIHIAPFIAPVFSDPESDSKMPAYDGFRNTQAQYILSERVLKEVADTLIDDKSITLFQEKAEGFMPALKQVWAKKDLGLLMKKNKGAVDTLRAAIAENKLAVIPEKRSEFIRIMMESPSSEEAKKIVKALLQAYDTVILPPYKDNVEKKILNLTEEYKRLSEEVKKQQNSIILMTEEYGMADMASRHDAILKRMEGTQEQLTLALASEESLKNLVNALTDPNSQLINQDLTADSAFISEMNSYINADGRYMKLAESIIQAEQVLIYAEQTLSPTNPDLEKKRNFIKILEDKQKERRDHLEKEFKDNIDSQKKAHLAGLATGKGYELSQAEAKLNNAGKYVALLQESLAKDNKEAIAVGRKHTLVQKYQDDLTLNRTLRDAVQQRVMQLEMERNRQPRITIHYEISAMELANKKIKLLAGVLFAALACGMGLAFMLSKADHSMYTPEDVIRIAGLPIIGTTVDSKTIKKNSDRNHLTLDYQNIRANLSLLNDGKIPKIMVVTSAEPREGKTTLAINLATSLARTGSRVLLIDGDLRKPDIHVSLDIPNGAGGFREVAQGICSLEDAVYSNFSSGLDILTSSGRNGYDPVHLLSGPHIAERLEV